MKKLAALALFCICVQFTYAQAGYTSVSYDKKTRPGLMIDLPYDEEVCEGFIVSNLKETGYNAETKGKLFWKQHKLNGFYVFKDVKLSGLDHTVDLYFKVDQKRKKEESVIYMLIGKGEDYFISNDDEKVYSAAKRFMNAFIDKAAEYKLQLDIEEQEELIKEAQKKMEKLIDNEKSMVKKKEELENDIKKNLSDQEDQAKLIEEEKKKLEELKKKS